MGLGVAATIAPLVYFKYYGFFTVNVTNAATSLGLHVAPPLIQVVLRVGGPRLEPGQLPSRSFHAP